MAPSKCITKSKIAKTIFPERLRKRCNSFERMGAVYCASKCKILESLIASMKQCMTEILRLCTRRCYSGLALGLILLMLVCWCLLSYASGMAHSKCITKSKIETTIFPETLRKKFNSFERMGAVYS